MVKLKTASIRHSFLFKVSSLEHVLQDLKGTYW